MLNWLKKALGGGKPSGQSNPDDLNKKELDALRNDLACLAKLEPGLEVKAFHYLVNGQEADLFPRLSKHLQSGIELRIQSCHNGRWPETRRTDRNFILSSSCINKPAFLLRFAKFLHVAAQPAMRSANPTLAQQAPWLEVLLREFYQDPHFPKEKRLRWETLGQVCAELRCPDALLQRCFLSPDGLSRMRDLGEMEGFGASLGIRKELVEECLGVDGAQKKSKVLERLKPLSPHLLDHSERILEFCFDSAKSVRQAAWAIVSSSPEGPWRELLEQACEEGKKTRRQEAIKLLNRLNPEQAKPFFLELLQQEKDESLRSLLEELCEPTVVPVLETLPLRSIPDSNPPPELRPLLAELVKIHERRASKPLPPDAAEKLMHELASYRPGSEPSVRIHLTRRPEADPIVDEILKLPGFNLVHLMRLSVCRGLLPEGKRLRRWNVRKIDQELGAYWQHNGEDFDLREFAQSMEFLGYELPPLGDSPILYMGQDWPDQAIWPFYAERLGELQEMFSDSSWVKRVRALEKVLLFPSPPEPLWEPLWNLAFEGAMEEKEMSQKALQRVAGFEKRILRNLGASKQGIREEAALWLAQLKLESSVTPLRDAAKTEKSESTKAALLTALEALGQDISEFVSLDALAEAAKKGLKKGVPAALDWLELETLPGLTRVNGEALDKDLTHWLVVRSYKLKEPKADPLLLRYSKFLNPEPSTDFALEIISRFVAEEEKDTRSSAIKSKGVLGLVGAFGDRRVAPIVERFLKKHYGNKLHQCKAFLHVLAVVKEPACLQLLLSVANRFRTKGLQAEARLLCQAVAEERGWNAEELADRTVPTAGLDEKGCFNLNFGERSFQVTLTEAGEFVIRDGEGELRKSLPKAGKQDDETLAKLAHKKFRANKKELKDVVRLQLSRFEEALVTQRVWRYGDWKEYLEPHPILGKLCLGFIWRCPKKDLNFRPIGDGSLADAENEEVVLKRDDDIILFHPLGAKGEELAAWEEHLKDYEVVSPLDQLGRPVLVIGETQKSAQSFDGFIDQDVQLFTLSSKLHRLGFREAQAEEGGWVDEYFKEFPSLSIRVRLEFSGASVPLENQTVSLGRVLFEKEGRELVLGEVPPVLFSEVCGQLRDFQQG